MTTLQKYLSIFSLLFLCTSNLLYSQLHIGRKPDIPSVQTYDFIRYGNAGANLHTGMINVSIPFYTYKDKDFEIPISFDYASDGFKPNSLSGILGHDWVLNVGGCITREIRGVPDDVYDYVTIPQSFGIGNGQAEHTSGAPCRGFYYLSSDNYSEDTDVEISFDDKNHLVFYHNTGETLYEIEPDIFHFNFMGYSGSFYYGYNNTVIVYHTNTYNGEFNIKLNTARHAPDNSFYNYFYFAPSIEITTGDGYKYFFGDLNPETNINNVYDPKDEGKFCFNGLDYKTRKNPLLPPLDQSPAPIISTWKLTKIIAPNGRTVRFNYGHADEEDSYKVLEYAPGSTLSYTSVDFAWQDYQSNCAHIEKQTSNIDSFKLYTDYLTSLHIDNVPYINFFYKKIKGESVKHVGNSWNNMVKQINNVYFKLDSINTPWKNCTLKYKFPTQPNSSEPINKIPFLDSINISGEGSYVFEYYHRTDKQFPHIGSFSLDHWGYYNGRNNHNPPVDLSTIYTQDKEYYTETILPKYTMLRDPAPECAIMGMLGWIKYPTGGYTVLHYEPNKYTTVLKRVLAYYYVPTLINVLPEKIAGGLRIKKIENYTNNNTLAGITTYSYEKGGISTGTLIHYPRYGIGYTAKLFADPPYTGNKIYNYNSLSDIWYYDKSHIEYSQITEKKSDDSKIIYHYPEYFNIPNTFPTELHSVRIPSKVCDSTIAFFAINNTRNYDYYKLIKNILKPEQSMFFERNRLIQKDIFDKNNVLLNSEKWSYDTVVNNLKSYKAYNTIGENMLITQMYSGDFLLAESKTINYFDANNSVTDGTEYTYNMQGQIQSITTTDSKGNEKKIKYKYLSDLTSYTGVLNTMRQKNLKNYPLSEEVYIKKSNTNTYVLLDGKRYVYRSITGFYPTESIVVPSYIELYNQETGQWEIDIKHNYYDKYGNILESENRNGIKTVFLWGYNGKYLIAEINNCSLSQVKNIPALANIETVLINGNTSNYETNLRQIPEAQITTFYYENFSRLTKIIDPSGRTTEYDFYTNQHGKVGKIFNELGIFTKYNYSTDKN